MICGLEQPATSMVELAEWGTGDPLLQHEYLWLIRSQKYKDSQCQSSGLQAQTPLIII